MHIKKTVSEAKIAANQQNSQKSTGSTSARGQEASSRNSLRHGILARKLALSDEENREYQRVLRCWQEFYHPIGELEHFLVEQIAMTSWKLGITEGLETRDLLRRRGIRDGIQGIFNGELELPVSDADLPIEGGWDCERLVVRALADKDKRNLNASRGPAILQNQVVAAIQTSSNSQRLESGHLQIEAVLGSSLQTLTKYRSGLWRDFYRAIEKLEGVQAARKETEKKDLGKKPPRAITQSD